MVAHPVPSRIDFDTDLVKHFVRVRGWIPAARYRKRRARRQGRTKLQYLTFCAAQAIDVFALEFEGILARDRDSGRLDGVYFCERQPEDFGEISTLIGSTEQGFLGEFTDIVLFAESAETTGRALDELSPEARDSTVRRLLSLKQTHSRMREAFPFDIINLDISGAIFPPHETAVSRIFESIRKVLDWQSLEYGGGPGVSEFTLFVTSRVAEEELHQEAISQILTLIRRNIDSLDPFRAQFAEKFGHTSAELLRSERFHEFFAIGLSKLLLHEALRKLWDTEYRAVFVYPRSKDGDPVYHIVSTVSHLKRVAPPKDALVNSDKLFPEGLMSRYEEESTETLRYTPWMIDEESISEGQHAALRGHLSSVVQYRDEFRSRLLD